MRYTLVVQPLCVRMARHRRDYKKHFNENVSYVTSFKILKKEDAFIELLENYPCSCKEELNKREGELMRENINCINKCIAGRSTKQYRQDNKDKIQQCRQHNKDKISAKFNVNVVENNYFHKSHHEKSFKHQQYINLHKKTE